MVFLQKPPNVTNPSQLQHPHLSVILAKFMCPPPPHSTGQTHMHTPWVTTPALEVSCTFLWLHCN